MQAAEGCEHPGLYAGPAGGPPGEDGEPAAGPRGVGRPGRGGPDAGAGLRAGRSRRPGRAPDEESAHAPVRPTLGHAHAGQLLDFGFGHWVFLHGFLESGSHRSDSNPTPKPRLLFFLLGDRGLSVPT